MKIHFFFPANGVIKDMHNNYSNKAGGRGARTNIGEAWLRVDHKRHARIFLGNELLGSEGRTKGQVVDVAEAGSGPRGHLGVTWGVYLCAGKPQLADLILSDPPDLTRCDSVIDLAIPAMSGHIQYRGAASGDLYIRISGINRVFLS